MPIFFRIFLPFFLLFSASCSTIPYSSVHKSLTPPDYLVDQYTPDQAWIAESREEIARGVWRVTFVPETPEDTSLPIIADYFPASPYLPAPGILVSPILGGKNRVADHFARYFADRGYHCIVVHRPEDLKKKVQSPEQLEYLMKQAVIRDRVVLDWFVRQPGVIDRALGSFGISYGGIKNTILAGVDQRLKVNTIALAGADIPSIIASSTLEELHRLRTSSMESNGQTLAELENSIRISQMTEPLRFAPYINPETTFLILARMDTTVPRKNGELLRQALGYPRTLYLPTGHYSGVFFTGMLFYPYIESKTLAFFNKHLLPLMESGS
ncbi:MAG: hypothetical protein ACOX5R_16720 [bacterium]